VTSFFIWQVYYKLSRKWSMLSYLRKLKYLSIGKNVSKLGCVFLMVVVSLPPNTFPYKNKFFDSFITLISFSLLQAGDKNILFFNTDIKSSHVSSKSISSFRIILRCDHIKWNFHSVFNLVWKYVPLFESKIAWWPFTVAISDPRTARFEDRLVRVFFEIFGPGPSWS